LDFKPTGSEDAHIRLWTGNQTGSFTDYTGAAKTYYGVGTLGEISSVAETTEVSAKNMELTLTGVPSEYLYSALTGSYRGRTAAVYMQVYNEARTTYQQATVFMGRMDQMIINEGETTSTITVKCESRLVDMNRAREKRYTAEYQKSIYPNDNGLDFIASMGGKSIYWGNTAPRTAVADPGGGDGNDGNQNEP
jgi:hypothetical protein